MTFDPVNSTFEFSALIVKASPFTVVAVAGFPAELPVVFAAAFADGSETVALALFAAGSSHAAANSDSPIAAVIRYFISPVS